jgi:hypothetical protein
MELQKLQRLEAILNAIGAEEWTISNGSGQMHVMKEKGDIKINVASCFDPRIARHIATFDPATMRAILALAIAAARNGS